MSVTTLAFRIVLGVTIVGCHSTGHDCASCADGGQTCSTTEPCIAQPTSSCAGATLRQYDGEGSCVSGTCSYGYSETTCAGSCNDGACVCGLAPWQSEQVPITSRSGTIGLISDSAGGLHATNIAFSSLD